MSLSLAFSSALSGLQVASRGTQLVADNIANAQSPGYGVRSLDQSARVVGGAGNGVRAVAVQRDVDQGLLTERRNAMSSASGLKVTADFWQEIERSFGMPDEAGSLVHQLGRLELSLSSAASNPESEVGLKLITYAVNELSGSFRSIQNDLLQQRDAADASIARDVAELNGALKEIARLNREIQRQDLLGGEPQALMDLRQASIDQVAKILPVTEIPRENGRIQLLAQDGTVLADRQAAEFSFDRTNVIVPSDLVEMGALSLLRLNGRTVPSQGLLLSEGRLGAAFQVRDILAPQIQTELDALATDLVSRFMTPDTDPTLPAGAFGLIEIMGEVTLPASPVGIAGKLGLNGLADPSSGGDIWRLRTGLYAAGPGFVADNAQLTRLASALTQSLPMGGTSVVARTLHGHATDTLSRLSASRLTSENQQGSASARLTAIDDAFNARGVDTDAELSKLLLLEQAYAANARVLATLDAMLRTVMEI